MFDSDCSGLGVEIKLERISPPEPIASMSKSDVPAKAFPVALNARPPAIKPRPFIVLFFPVFMIKILRFGIYTVVGWIWILKDEKKQKKS